MSPRPSFTSLQRATIFRDNDGRCHLCTRKIAPGEEWEVEHVKPRALGGSDTAENLKPAHVDCHAGKTRKERVVIAKADRALKRHVGIKKRSTFPKRRTA
jgi:5-methylcytosine-specific restriction protein A